MAIASGVGVTLAYSDWRHLVSEDPHRFLFAAAPSDRPRVEGIAAEAGIPLTRLGSFGGDAIVFSRGGTRAVVEMEVAASTYTDAIPRRLH
jgi:phosphoribosylformylglycinamidine synthase